MKSLKVMKLKIAEFKSPLSIIFYFLTFASDPESKLAKYSAPMDHRLQNGQPKPFLKQNWRE